MTAASKPARKKSAPKLDAPTPIEVCCLNVGHDFFSVMLSNESSGEPVKAAIVCRKCGELRKIA